MRAPKKPSAVSAEQFKRLQGKVTRLEKWKKEIEEWKKNLSVPPAPDRTDVTDQDEMEKRLQERKGQGWLSKYRRFVKRNPLFWTAGCLILGYLIGCFICDLSTFGRY